MSSLLVEDECPIDTIFLPGEDDFYAVGHHGVTKIEVYDENGEMARVPWIAVYKGEEVVMRSAARHWIIEYNLSDQ